MEKMLRLSPDRAADIIVRGIEKRKRRVLVGNDAKIAALMERIAPVRHLDLLIKRFAQKDATR
jgi:short-subunit dehydrogenase